MAGPKKANPYAPNDARRNNKGSNRYGPGASTAASSNNRYRLEPKSTDENLTGTASGTPFSGVLDTSEQTEDNAPIDDAKTDDVPEEKEAPSGEVKAVEPEDHPSETASQLPPPPPPSGINRVPKTPVASKRRVANQGEKRNPYAPAAKPVPTNVDTSFDVSNQEDPEDQIDEPRAPLILNAPASPPSNFRQGFVNPYQEGKKANADLPIQNGFDEFPIPGSPEYTTRANSVIGHTGLYSSRLSQSQQSALYQQYEVKDDTVLDYVPVPEENEDDDAEALKKEARRKKDMADAKNKIQEEMSRRGGGENAKVVGLRAGLEIRRMMTNPSRSEPSWEKLTLSSMMKSIRDGSTPAVRWRSNLKKQHLLLHPRRRYRRRNHREKPLPLLPLLLLEDQVPFLTPLVEEGLQSQKLQARRLPNLQHQDQTWQTLDWTIFSI